MLLFTGNGYKLTTAASALQKSIRRGLEVEAMFWAAEIETKFHDYLWQRLQIISIEDIGIGDMAVVLYVAEMRRLYAELRKKHDSGHGRPSFRMVLANAILAMCRAPKCRIGDEFQIVIYGRRAAGLKLDVPDYALDMHTSEGRRKGRSHEHFFAEGTCLANPAPVENPYTDEARRIRCERTEQPETPDSGVQPQKGGKSKPPDTGGLF